jgi:hypothetical protein
MRSMRNPYPHPSSWPRPESNASHAPVERSAGRDCLAAHYMQKQPFILLFAVVGAGSLLEK